MFSSPADPVEFRRKALLATLLVSTPAAVVGLANARQFPAATGFDLAVMAGMLVAVVVCLGMIVSSGKLSRLVGPIFIAVFGVGFSLRIAGTFLGPHADMPLAELAPPYLGWLPLYFVLAFVLLQSARALYASLLFYAFTSAVVLAYAAPRLLAAGAADSAVIGLIQQFLFGHLAYILLLSVIPLLHARYASSEKELESVMALRRSEQRFMDAFQVASIGKALVSPSGRFMSINDALCDLLGYSREALLRLDFQSITHPDDLNDDLGLMRQLIDGRINHYRMEKRYLHKDGSVVWAILSVSVVRNAVGEPDYFVSQIQDVTAEHNYRQRLRAANEKLLAASEELKRSNAELESFAYMASHDLREPLRGVKGFAELLRKKHGEALDDQGQQCLEYLARAADRGDMLVRALLSYSRVGHRREAASKAVGSRDEAMAALDGLQATIEASKAVVDLPAEMPLVLANPAELQIVFQNLFSNAIKYARKDVAPHIGVSVRMLGDEAEFSVADNGVGFEPEYRQEIFEPFRRLHQSDLEGSGIGLAICRKAIEAHGGRIHAESKPGEGTCMRFTLKVARGRDGVTNGQDEAVA